MAKYKIVLVPFPFDDFSSTKVRPAVCLTNPIGKFEHIVIAFITSQIPAELLDTDIVVDEKQKNFKKSGLTVSSVIRIHKLMTIPKNLIKRELGRLDAELQKEIENKIIKLFKD